MNSPNTKKIEIPKALKDRKKLFLELLKKHAGNVSLTCEAMQMGRTTFYDWKTRDKKFAQEVDDQTQGIVDFVESKLMSNINKGKETSIIFFLKTRAKDRGYVERQEIEHDGGITLPAKIDVHVHE